MRIRFLLILSIFTIFNTIVSFRVQAQSPDDVIDPVNINFGYLEELTKLEIDSVRINHGLKPLFNDSILFLAADEQAKYVLNKGKLDHFQQNNPKKKTPIDRINFFGWKNYVEMAGENLIKIYILSNTISINKKTHKKSAPHVISTYKQAAVEMMTGWVNSPKHYENIITKEYNITGFAIAYNSKSKAIYAAQVFGKNSKINLKY